MDFTAARKNLIDKLSRNVSNRAVLDAVFRVPREDFVPHEYLQDAYDDRPLPIGFQQTISQPLIVAMMTQALELTGTEKVLEVGTGSGYQTAILAELAGQVISTERIPELADTARQTLDRLGYKNVDIHVTGRTLGWPEEAPYDAIIVTAGAPDIPQVLIDQLKIGGILIIPAGSRTIQELYKVTRLKTKIKSESLGGCRFVPLIGEESWQDYR